MRSLWTARSREGAGSHTIAEPEIGHGDALVQTFARAQFETGAVLPVKPGDAGEIGPKEGAVGKDAASDDGSAAIAMLSDQTLGDHGRIVGGCGPHAEPISKWQHSTEAV